MGGRRDDVGGLEEGDVGEAERLVLSGGPRLGEEGRGGGVAELVEEGGRGGGGEGVLQGVGEAEDEWVGEGAGPEAGEAGGGGGVVAAAVVVVEEGGEGGDGHGRARCKVQGARWNASTKSSSSSSNLLLCRSSCGSRLLLVHVLSQTPKTCVRVYAYSYLKSFLSHTFL